jgi:8-oxo-dGTP diphosphatase
VLRYARHLGLAVETEPDLTEEGHRTDSAASAARAAVLARQPFATVLCSHRPVLPTILEAMGAALDLSLLGSWERQAWDPRLPPGGFIVAHREFTEDGSVRVVGLERHTLTGA